MLLCQIQKTEFQVVRSFLRIQNSQKRGGARITGLKQQRASVWSAGGGDAGIGSRKMEDAQPSSLPVISNQTAAMEDAQPSSLPVISNQTAADRTVV